MANWNETRSQAIKRLQSGENWGSVWNSVKKQFPSLSNKFIDEQLGGSGEKGTGWAAAGAYEKYKAQPKSNLITALRSSAETTKNATTAPKQSNLISSLRTPAKSATVPITNYLNTPAKPSMPVNTQVKTSLVTPTQNNPKKSNLIESLRKSANIIPKIGATVGGFATDVVASIPKSFVQIGLSGEKFIEGTDTATFRPQSRLGKAILGNEVKDAQTTGKEFLQGVGMSDKTAKTYGPTVGVVLALSDLIPGGGGKKSVIKYLAKEDDAIKIAKILTKAGMKADDIAPYAQKIAKTSDVKTIENTLSEIDNLSKTSQKTTAQNALRGVKNENVIDDTSVKGGIKNAMKANDEIVAANKAAEGLKNDKGATQEVMKTWYKNMTVGKAKAQKAANDFKIDENIDNIFKHERGEQYAGREVAQKKFDKLFKEAEEKGLEFSKRENYMPHVYNENPAQVKEAVKNALRSKGMSEEDIADYLEGAELPPEIAKSLKMNPFFTKDRVFETYEDAAQYGLTPKYETVKQLVGHYTEKMNEALSNRQLVKDLIDTKQITSEPRYGYLSVNLPGQEGAYFAKPKVAAYINDVFRNEEALNGLQKGAKAMAKTNQFLQNIVLAGGFPKSNLNFFSLGYVVKSLTAGVGNVATLNIKGAKPQIKVLNNFIRSNWTPSATKWFAKRVDNGTLERMAREGIDMSNFIGNYKEVNRGLKNFFKKTPGIKEKIGVGYDRIISEKTFNSFLPMQNITLFEDTYSALIKKGLSEQEASKIAGNTVKKFSGFSDKVIGKTSQDTLGALFFAPKFREGLIHTYWNTITGIGDPRLWKDAGYAQNRRLAAGMIVTFAGYDYLNQKLSGHHIWENPQGKQTELMIPGKEGKVYYTPFMPSQLAFFRNMIEGGLALGSSDTKTFTQKIGSNLSMVLKMGTDIVSNKDYFGNEIRDEQENLGQQAKDIAKYLGLNFNHPYVKGMITIVGNTRAEKMAIYPTYKKIAKLIDEGKREEADTIVDALSEEDRKAYYELKEQRIKPIEQVFSEMLELPIRFSSVGKIKAAEYYQKIDDIERAIKATPEDQQTDKIQEYITNTPEEDRQGVLYALRKDGIDVTGVSISSDTIRMKPVYEEVQRLVQEGKEDEAMQIIYGMTDEDYEAYKKVKASENAKISKNFKKKLEYDPAEAVKYLRSLDEEQGNRLLDNMSDEEYAKYEEGKNGL